MHAGEVNSYSAKKHLGTIIIACLTAESENYMLCLIMTLFFFPCTITVALEVVPVEKLRY